MPRSQDLAYPLYTGAPELLRCGAPVAYALAVALRQPYRAIKPYGKDNRAMAAFQVHQGGIHAIVEAIQNETACREGAFKVSGAPAQDDWSRCDSNQSLIPTHYQNTKRPRPHLPRRRLQRSRTGNRLKLRSKKINILRPRIKHHSPRKQPGRNCLN